MIKQFQCNVLLQDQPTPKKQKLEEAAALQPAFQPLRVIVLVRHGDYAQEGNQGLTALDSNKLLLLGRHSRVSMDYPVYKNSSAQP